MHLKTVSNLLKSAQICSRDLEGEGFEEVGAYCDLSVKS
jgi:hypothetical protein